MWFIFVFACVLFTSLNAQTCEKLYGRAEAESLEQAGLAVNNLAINLYKEIARANPDRDVLFSPASIAMALAFIEAGSDGNTKRELAKALLPSGLNIGTVDKLYSALNRKLEINDRNTKVSIANGLFYAHGLEIKRSYSDKIKKCYNTEIKDVPFYRNPERARNEINRWVSEETEGKISELFKEPTIDHNTLAVLANAIYLEANWDKPFEEKLEHLQFGSRRIPLEFLHRKGHLRYAKTHKFEAVSVPFSDKNLAMIFLLPNKKDGIKSIEKDMDLVDFQQVFSRLSVHDVTAKIPKFSTRQSLDMKKVLESLGVRDIFSDSANFTGIVEKRPPTLKISTGIHEASIKVNQRGLEAAAAGAGIKPIPSSVPVENPPSATFTADHPFIFAIVDTSVEYRNWPILFLGKVMLPFSVEREY